MASLNSYKNNNSLSFKVCLGTEKPDRLYHASLNTAQIIQYGQQNYGLNISNDQAQAIMNASGGGDPSQIATAFGALPQVQQQQMLSNANALQQFQVQANQPAISTLQSQYNPATGSGALVDRYNSLLSSINQQGSVAANQTILGASNNLASRGIIGGGLQQEAIGSALLPVSAAYAGLTAQTGLGEQQDLSTLAGQIAQLQAGDPTASITGAQNLSQLALQAQELPSQIALNQAQSQAAQAQAAYANTEAKYIPLASGANLFNTNTGSINNTGLSLLQQLGINLTGL